jgi:phosphoserine phosphatase RsbU/P
MASIHPAASPCSVRGRVLVIEDDPEACSVFRRILQRRGHEVVEAVDGRQGLAAAQRESPEIVVLDLNLPGMGGLELLGEFSQQMPDVPVIIVSGTGQMGDAIEALRLGAWDFLTKPLPDTSALIHTVEANLQRSRLIRLNKKITGELELHLEQIREDEEAGRKIQARLFPAQDWALGPYRFQHQVIPSLFLSGDFVDYFSIDDRFAGFYCADVSGHGVSSALVTVLVKSLVTKYREHYHDRLDRLILEPERLLAQLNKDILLEEIGKHLTMFYGVLDLNANVLRHASGGQYPPPLLFGNDEVRTLTHKGMAVGLFPTAAFEANSLPLPAAFRLLILSDGALDALPLPTPEAKLDFLRSLSTEASLRAFVDQARAHRHLPDDLAMLSVSRGETP